jgi:hypothetical protein
VQETRESCYTGVRVKRLGVFFWRNYDVVADNVKVFVRLPVEEQC